MSGFIAVSRAFWDDTDFRDSEMSQREAFLWMLAEASWKPRAKRIKSAVINLDRGQLAASTRFLASAFGWSEARVRRYLDMLKNRRTIDAATDAGVTVITIRNYDKYQSAPSESDAPRETKPTQQRRTSDANENKETNTTLLTREEIDEVSRRAREAVGDAIADPAKAPGVLVPSDILAWLKNGADLDLDILPAIRARSARASPGSIRSWAYFREPVMQAKARREAEIETPEVDHDRTDKATSNTARHRSAFSDALRELDGCEGIGGLEPDDGEERCELRIVDGRCA